MAFPQHRVFARFMARRAVQNERRGQAGLRDEQLAAADGRLSPNWDTLAAIRDSGFTVESVRGLLFPPDAGFSVVGPRILGVARG